MKRWFDVAGLGQVILEAGNTETLTAVSIVSRHPGFENEDSALLEAVEGSLRSYFAGNKPDFSWIPLDPKGTDFQKTVWQALLTIPYGETRSYRWLAETVGNVNAARAVGQANGKNPIPVIIPCHRVISHDGSLGGYSGGLSVKRFLLGLETQGSPVLQVA